MCRQLKGMRKSTAIQLLRNIHEKKNNEIHIISNLPCIEHTTEKKNMEDSPHFAIRKAGRRRISKKKQTERCVSTVFIHLGRVINEEYVEPLIIYISRDESS